MAQTYQRYDHTLKGAGLANEGYSLGNPQQVLEYFNRMSTNPHDANEKRFVDKVRTYAKNNRGSWTDPNYVAQAVDWAFRDDMRKNKKPPKMFGPLDSIIKPALTLAASAVNPALGAVVGGGLGAANDGGIIGGLLGAAGGYAGGNAINSIASNGLKAFGKELLANPLQTLGGAATKLVGAGGGGSGGSGGGVGSALLSAAPQLAGAAFSMLGSGGSDPYEATLLAQRNAEAARTAARTAGTNAVNTAMNNQGDYYDRLRSSVFDFQKGNLDRERDDQSRELKFELARRGHLGGSAEIDAVGDLTRLYQEGLLNAGTVADDAVRQTRAGDQNARAQAIRDITLDVDQNTALNNAVSQAQLASAQALDSARGQNLGDVFGNLGYLYQQGQAKRERQRATTDYYGRRGTSVGPASSASGTINRLG